MSLHDKFLAVRDELRGCLLERETAIDNALLALLTGEHFIQFGPPGVAKSRLVRALCARITGAVYFEKAMSPLTAPEDIYGPIDLIRLSDHGEWVRRDIGSMSRAHIVFLDEITRCNEALRDTLLVAMNERLAQVVGYDPYTLPLMSLFSAANHPFEDKDAAFNDRFLLRQHITPIHEAGNFRALLTGKLPDWRTIHASVTLDDIQTAQLDIKTVKGTREALDAFDALRERLTSDGVYVSDRRWGQVGALVKARAWLDGIAEMDLDSLAASLPYALWSSPKEENVVARAVYEICAPLDVTALETQDVVDELIASLPEPNAAHWRDSAENAMQCLADAHAKLKRAIAASNARHKERALAALTTLEEHYASLGRALQSRIKTLSLAS